MTRKSQDDRSLRMMRPCLLMLALALAAPSPAAGVMPQAAPPGSVALTNVMPQHGFIPPPGDLSHIRTPMPSGPAVLTSRFDWRETGDVSPVKSQGSCGSCYSFASLGNFESKILFDGGSVFDFSENNVKECEWHESSCGGGNYWRVANFLSIGGTVLETCDPYVPANVACITTCAYQKTLLDWCVISSSSVPTTDALKSYIQTYGPIYTTMYAGNGDAWYSEMIAYDGSYTLHYTGPEDPNHAVLLIGWDDSQPHAGGQGAWIVKNSWGTSWGGTCDYGTERGYFYIAYESAKIGSYSSFLYDWQNYNPNGSVLYHDEAGYTSAIGYGTTTAWGLCKFIAAEDIQVERVEFWTLDQTIDIDVYIYDDFNGTSVSNLLTSQLNRPFSHPGYHSVELASPISVSSGEDVYAVVKITDASYTYPLAFDGLGTPMPGYCYTSLTGGTYSLWSSGDLGIRLRVTDDASCGGIIEDPAIVEICDVPADNGGFVRLSWRKSLYDAEGASPEVQRYKIWRRRNEVLPELPIVGSDPVPGGPYEHGEGGPAWEVVATVGATGDCCYEFDVPTHCDSSGSDTCWTYYYVTAHTGDIGWHYDSPMDRGYSIDNLGMLHGPPLRDGSETLPPDAVRPGRTFLETPEPNPGDRGVVIRFELATPDWVQVEVYDITGRQVAVLSDGFLDSGSHSILWDSVAQGEPALSPGLYFVRLVTSSEIQTAKWVLVR